MALKQADVRRVATAIEMLTRAILVDNDAAAAVNLQKAKDVIDKILKQGQRLQKIREDGEG